MIGALLSLYFCFVKRQSYVRNPSTNNQEPKYSDLFKSAIYWFFPVLAFGTCLTYQSFTSRDPIIYVIDFSQNGCFSFSKYLNWTVPWRKYSAKNLVIQLIWEDIPIFVWVNVLSNILAKKFLFKTCHQRSKYQLGPYSFTKKIIKICFFSQNIQRKRCHFTICTIKTFLWTCNCG